MRKLLLLILAAPLLGQDAIPEDVAAFDKLRNEHRATVQKFYEDFQQARKDNPALAFDFSKHPDRRYKNKYAELAGKYPGTDGAAKALVQVARLDRNGDLAQRAIATLLADHITSKEIKDLIRVLRHSTNGEAALRRIVEESPQAEVKGLATLVLGQVTKSSNEKEALELFETVRTKYGDQIYFRTMTLGSKAASEIFEVKHLSVGKVAPEIEGEDISGEPMKLSDFRGKVVFLDFWGDW